MFWTGIVLQTRGLSRELAKNCVTLDMGVSVSARSAVPQFFYPKYLIEHLITLTSAGKKKNHVNVHTGYTVAKFQNKAYYKIPNSHRFGQ